MYLWASIDLDDPAVPLMHLLSQMFYIVGRSSTGFALLYLSMFLLLNQTNRREIKTNIYLPAFKLLLINRYG